MLVMLFLSVFTGEEVTLNLKAPREVSAGSEFDVVVTLNKGSFESFARYQQELPRGLSAQLVESNNASFSFEDQKVKFIWLRLPTDKEFKISYRVKVDERLKGKFDIKGLFSYIDGNERKSSQVSVDNILIQPSTRIDPNLIVDISEFQRVIPAQPPVSLLASNVKVARQTPFYTGEANDMSVRILVNKGNTEKFAKIEEDIPQGYTAEALQTRDAIFTFKDNKAKFLWMNLPSDKRFIVSYRLMPINGQGEVDLKIKGTFSFIVNDVTRVIDIIQRDADFSNLDPSYLDNILASIPTNEITPSELRGSATSTSYTAGEGGKEFEVKYQKIEDKPRTSAKPIELDKQHMLEPEEGVYYRVQIAAGHRLVDIKRYFMRFKITEDIRTERHEGWIKYSIGSFPQYKEARDYRTKLWSTTAIDDAFVAAYNNGVRITVQEALMITNQKWYR
jgi:hypothetical protein